MLRREEGKGWGGSVANQGRKRNTGYKHLYINGKILLFQLSFIPPFPKGKYSISCCSKKNVCLPFHFKFPYFSYHCLVYTGYKHAKPIEPLMWNKIHVKRTISDIKQHILKANIPVFNRPTVVHHRVKCRWKMPTLWKKFGELRADPFRGQFVSAHTEPKKSRW